MSLALLAALPVKAQAQNPSGDQRYEIPAEAVDRALDEFGVSAHLNLLYEKSAVAGKRANAVAGTMSREAALAELLRGTGLNFRFTTSTSALIYPADSLVKALSDGSPSSGAPARLMLNPMQVTAPMLVGSRETRFGPYARDLATAVSRYLQDQVKADDRPFHAELAVRVDGSGAVDEVVIVKATGDKALVDRIIGPLTRMHIAAPPPPDMPQPIFFNVEGR